MKKFTWIIALSMISVLAHSENKNDQQTRLNESLKMIYTYTYKELD